MNNWEMTKSRLKDIYTIFGIITFQLEQNKGENLSDNLLKEYRKYCCNINAEDYIERENKIIELLHDECDLPCIISEIVEEIYNKHTKKEKK